MMAPYEAVMPTPDEIAALDAAALAAATAGVRSVTAGDRTVVAEDPLKLLDVSDRLAARGAMSGANANGGPKSMWGRSVTGRARFGGHVQ